MDEFKTFMNDACSKYSVPLDHVFCVEEKFVKVDDIIHILSMLPESKKNEIKMIISIDDKKEVSPLRLLAFIAKNSIRDDNER